jgi:hypothetical protein
MLKNSYPKSYLLSNINYYPELYYFSVLSVKNLPFITKKKRQFSLSGLNTSNGHLFCNAIRFPGKTQLVLKTSDNARSIRIATETPWFNNLSSSQPFFYTYVNYLHFFKQFTLCYLLFYIFHGFVKGAFSNFFTFALRFDNFKIPLKTFLKTTKKYKKPKKHKKTRKVVIA